MCNGAHWAWAETVEQRTTENSIRCRIIISFLSLSVSLSLATTAAADDARK